MPQEIKTTLDFKNVGRIVNLPDGVDAQDAATVHQLGAISGAVLPAGGTTGQIIKKQSNTDYDVDWEDAPLLAWGFGGDINNQTDLISGGKILPSLLPALAITDTFVVGSQVAMLALTAETGDIAVRTDETKTYILKGTDPSVLADWELLLTPTGGVVSVFGRSGAVTAQSGDYSFSLISGVASTAQGGAPAGGSSGYVLTKNSATDYDYSWAAAAGGGGALWTANGDDIYYATGKVGIKTDSPSQTLHIVADRIQDGGIGGLLLEHNSAYSSPALELKSGANFKWQIFSYYDGGISGGNPAPGELWVQAFKADNTTPYPAAVKITPSGGLTFVSMTCNSFSAVNGGVMGKCAISYGVRTNFAYTNAWGEQNMFEFYGNASLQGTTVEGTLRGFYFNPNIVNVSHTTVIGFQNTYGKNLFNSVSGATGIGVSAIIDASAILQVDSTTKGFLPPRMTTTNWGLIATKAEGLQTWSNDDHAQLWFDGTGTIGFRFNRATSKFQGYDGTNWIDLN